jgi:ribonuclease D
MFSPTITKDELAALPLGMFPGRVVVVETSAQLAEACRHMRTCAALGFDTETRPTFTAGVVHRVALLQLSTPKVCYLIRLCKLHLERPLAAILENPNILKVGAALPGDIQALQRLRRFRQGGFVDLQNIVHEWGITEKSVRKMAAIVLGMRISKAQRLSNWEAAALTASQQSYAATDAWACLEIYNRLHHSPKSPPAEQVTQ